MHNIRVSSATASLLRLRHWKTDISPTTLYFMLGETCSGNCKYCTQGNGQLSRVQWPTFPLIDVQKQMRICHGPRRICLQTLLYKKVVDDVFFAANALKESLPISVAINPVSAEQMEHLKSIGVERLGLGLDCCSPDIFRQVKKSVPSWESYWEALSIAADIFGTVTTHLIIGLGETDEEAIQVMQHLHEKGSDIALFAHFPQKKYGTAPSIPRYRSMQLAKHMITRGLGLFQFDRGKLTFIEGPVTSQAFQTSGCPNCNRPFYNERARGPFYNVPRPLYPHEYKQALSEVKKYVEISNFIA